MGLIGRIYVEAGDISAFLHRTIKIDGILYVIPSAFYGFCLLWMFLFLFILLGKFISLTLSLLIGRKKYCCICNTYKLYSLLYNMAV